MTQVLTPPHHAHGAEHPHGHELGFWRKYVFSTDHKVIGIQYAVTGLLFLLFGFCLMMLMRWQLAFPGRALPLIGRLFGEARMPGGSMLPEFYNELGAMHGTIMVFLGVFSHPFFAVTKPDGSFSIAGLPAGSYEIEAWHEKLGTKTGKVTVGADGSGKVDFSFSPPAGK